MSVHFRRHCSFVQRGMKKAVEKKNKKKRESRMHERERWQGCRRKSAGMKGRARGCVSVCIEE